MTQANNNLIALDEFDGYKVSDKDPDVRGWRVISQDGVKIGDVKELIVDRNAMNVRYIDIQLNKDLFDRKVERRILVPIGLAVVDRDDKKIHLDATPVSDVLTLPPFAPGPINRDFEMSIRRALSRSEKDLAQTGEGEFYEHDHFKDRGFYSRRESSPLERA